MSIKIVYVRFQTSINQFQLENYLLKVLIALFCQVRVFIWSFLVWLLSCSCNSSKAYFWPLYLMFMIVLSTWFLLRSSSLAYSAFWFTLILLELPLWQDIRRSVPGNTQPPMTKNPASSTNSVRSGPRRKAGSVSSDTRIATISRTSSEVSVDKNSLHIDGCQVEDDIISKRDAQSPASVDGRWYLARSAIEYIAAFAGTSLQLELIYCSWKELMGVFIHRLCKGHMVNVTMRFWIIRNLKENYLLCAIVHRGMKCLKAYWFVCCAVYEMANSSVFLGRLSIWWATGTNYLLLNFLSSL